ncbi:MULTISPECIES: 2-phospho-L-lactate guanylyltransferase [unclassified Diaminobutyricimonas]|uniref:2-phospho-L-lactate guanylyltransferase n=1 Tax=unclassified Diaminobutyricimonas TaxID=2643261 RepID=UPI0012F49B90|nr:MULTISPECIES: 2-phospho-L-lactate guanylyltransferase [unclassified Diaminobutyricimonas]
MPAWSLVLPIKGAIGKSRLDVADAADRRELAVAFALDALDAVLTATSVGRVVVVTADEELAAGLPERVELMADPRHGLNAAIRAGLAVLDPAAPGGVLLADLPALRPDELDAALEMAAQHPLALVPDAAGTGSTLTTALRADSLVPRFGEGSRSAHEQSGHVVLAVPETSGLRRDVDSLADLDIARTLGLGRHTRAVLD